MLALLVLTLVMVLRPSTTASSDFAGAVGSSTPQVSKTVDPKQTSLPTPTVTQQTVKPAAPTQAPEFQSIASSLNSVIRFVYILLYIVGAMLITMASFQLKNGDIRAFTKNMIGGMAIFGSKFLIQALFSTLDGKY
jgi:hypothetical protein